jgi:hypothetical protein
MLKQSLKLIILIYCAASILFAQEPVDLQIIQRIKVQAFDESQVMETTSFLTDVYGPRLTGSPNYLQAAEWSVERIKEWGIKKVSLESWGTFGNGWTMEKVSLEMIEPRYMFLIAYPKAWTPGTDSVVTGIPIFIDYESDDDMEKYKGSLKGAIIMLGKAREIEPKFEADAKRYSDEALDDLAKAPDPGAKPARAEKREEFRNRMKQKKKYFNFLKDEGVALILEPSQREHGTVRLGRGGSYEKGADPEVPNLVIAVEHYGRLTRIMEKNIPLKLRSFVQNTFHDSDSLGYNVIAEIPGVDKKLKKEVVMLGAHLDSWHAGTGATDNGANCAVVMEAMRILKHIDAKPRRTIRMALWGGEEQGYYGSRGYIKNHFGDRSSMKLKPEHNYLSAYFNLDNGAGKIRGIYLQGNDAARPIFEAWLKPFNDMGATTVSIRNTGGTDHIPFNEIGLPGFQFIQDEIDYMTRTHHTNMDVYEHIIPGDVMQSAAIMASFVYHAAMRDGKIPRKEPPQPKEDEE